MIDLQALRVTDWNGSHIRVYDGEYRHELEQLALVKEQLTWKIQDFPGRTSFYLVGEDEFFMCGEFFMCVFNEGALFQLNVSDFQLPDRTRIGFKITRASDQPSPRDWYLCPSDNYGETLMALRVLHALGFEGKDTPPGLDMMLTQHERMELRCAMPPEFWRDAPSLELGSCPA